MLTKNHQEVEHSLITKFRKTIWHPFVKGISKYQMIEEEDRIAVCISGGKDSMLLAKCLEELQKHGKKKIELIYFVMNPGYEEKNIRKIKENAKLLNLKIEISNSDIFAVANKLSPEHPCYMCARMRRGFLYKKARELGCNKIALGHHFDDVIETILLSMFYSGEFKTMMPKLKSKNFKGIELIRPLYLVRESEIKKFWDQNGYQFINCACQFTTNQTNNSKRLEVKKLLSKLRENTSIIDNNIFKSSEKVNLDTIISYEQNQKITNFLDTYNKD